MYENHYLQYMRNEMTKPTIKFSRTGIPGFWTASIDGKVVADIMQRSDRSFWYSDTHYAVAADLTMSADTLKEIKAEMQRAVEEHTGKTVWHTRAVA